MRPGVAPKGHAVAPPHSGGRFRPAHAAPKGLCTKFARKMSRCSLPKVVALKQRLAKLAKPKAGVARDLSSLAPAGELGAKIRMLSLDSFLRDCLTKDYTSSGVSCVLEATCKELLKPQNRCAGILGRGRAAGAGHRARPTGGASPKTAPTNRTGTRPPRRVKPVGGGK